MGAVDDKRLLILVLDQAGSDKLLHHVRRELARLHILCQLHDLLLQRTNLVILLSVIYFFLGCCFFLGLDLRLGPTALAGDLKHVCRNTFAD